MACRLFGTKPSPGPVLTYCQLDPQEKNFSENSIEIYTVENVIEKK